VKLCSRIVCALTLLVSVSACSGVAGSGVATGGNHAAYQGEVRVFAAYEPSETEQVGLIEARSHGQPLEKIVDELRRQAAQLGGNVAKIDRVRSKFEMVQRTRTESYSCGTTQAPRTCTRQVTEWVEVRTTTVFGRAYRIGEG
jgi:hypothetical protein